MRAYRGIDSDSRLQYPAFARLAIHRNIMSVNNGLESLFAFDAILDLNFLHGKISIWVKKPREERIQAGLLGFRRKNIGFRYRPKIEHWFAD